MRSIGMEVSVVLQCVCLGFSKAFWRRIQFGICILGGGFALA